MTQLSVKRIPRRILVACLIVIAGTAIITATAPYSDRIKSGFDHCVQGCLQDYGQPVFQGLINAAHRYDDGKALQGMWRDFKKHVLHYR